MRIVQHLSFFVPHSLDELDQPYRSICSAADHRFLQTGLTELPSTESAIAQTYCEPLVCESFDVHASPYRFQQRPKTLNTHISELGHSPRAPVVADPFAPHVVQSQFTRLPNDRLLSQTGAQTSLPKHGIRNPNDHVIDRRRARSALNVAVSRNNRRYEHSKSAGRQSIQRRIAV